MVDVVDELTENEARQFEHFERRIKETEDQIEQVQKQKLTNDKKTSAEVRRIAAIVDSGKFSQNQSAGQSADRTAISQRRQHTSFASDIQVSMRRHFEVASVAALINAVLITTFRPNNKQRRPVNQIPSPTALFRTLADRATVMRGGTATALLLHLAPCPLLT